VSLELLPNLKVGEIFLNGTKPHLVKMNIQTWFSKEFSDCSAVTLEDWLGRCEQFF